MGGPFCSRSQPPISFLRNWGMPPLFMIGHPNHREPHEQNTSILWLWFGLLHIFFDTLTWGFIGERTRIRWCWRHGLGTTPRESKPLKWSSHSILSWDCSMPRICSTVDPGRLSCLKYYIWTPLPRKGAWIKETTADSIISFTLAHFSISLMKSWFSSRISSPLLKDSSWAPYAQKDFNFRQSQPHWPLTASSLLFIVSFWLSGLCYESQK